MSERERLILHGHNAELRVGHALSRGWELFARHPLQYIIWALLYAGITSGLQYAFRQIDINDTKGSMQGFGSLLTFPLAYGPFLAASHEIREGGVGFRFSSLFKGYLYVLPLIVIWILTDIFLIIGLILCVLPFFYLLIALWATPLVYLEYHDELGIFGSFSVCRKVSHRHWCSLLLLALGSILYYILGLLFCGVGIFVALPVVTLAWTDAFDQMFGFRPHKHVDGCVVCV